MINVLGWIAFILMIITILPSIFVLFLKIIKISEFNIPVKTIVTLVIKIIRK